MVNEIVSYNEMCGREKASLQRGMNFALGGGHSVILMSVRPNAPYDDRLEDGGTILIYEGHDANNVRGGPDPKSVDQPEHTHSGKLTQNGRFHAAAQAFKAGKRPPERVRVYEKIKPGIWSYNGVFHLEDSWLERSGDRWVFKFRLAAVIGEHDTINRISLVAERRRVIPSHVKLEVWKRDGGKCTKCGATDELHFDHVVPYSLGGSSLIAENVQLLCARHNLEKRDKIE